MRPLIFNISRLASRQHSCTPTGVDRVDIRHARHVLEQADQRTVIFVHQQKDVLSQVPLLQARQLIDNLWQRWILSQPMRPLPQISRLRRFLRWLHMRYRRRSGQLISADIVRAMEDKPAPVYLNSGQAGAHHLHLHQLLKDQLGASIVFYLHDLIPIDYPEYFRIEHGSRTHQQRLESIAKTATIVLVNSQYTQQRFAGYCRKHALPLPPTSILPIGVEECFINASTRPSSPIPSHLQNRLGAPYFMAVGTIEPRKNHLLLLHIWRRLARTLGKQCPKLLLVGRRGWENENIIDMIERSPAIRQHVLELNHLNDTDLIALLQNAQALLMPSFDEGWGIPVTEALTLGTPVICSDIPALRESTQAKATFLDPLDGIAWQQAITGAIGTQPEKADGYTPHQWPQHLAALAGHLNCGL